MPADETRVKRAAALEEKKKRLEALKARRSGRAGATTTDGGSVSSAGSSTLNAVKASKTGNLDDYIDGLLNSPPPIAPVTGAYQGTTTKSTAVEAQSDNRNESATTPAATVTAPSPSDSGSTEKKNTDESPVDAAPTKPAVETFVISTQTNEDDFPETILTVSDDNEGINDDNEKEKGKDTENQEEKKEEEKQAEHKSKEPKVLNSQQVQETVTSAQFTTFLTSASKKVERLLGAPILSDLLVSDANYYTDAKSKEQDDVDDQNKEDTNKFISAQVEFNYPKWTNGRDVTSVDWSPHHRGELMLASYHRKLNYGRAGSGTDTSNAVDTPTSQSANNPNLSTAVASLTPKPKPASTLQPSSKSEMTLADGLVILWNLTMPSRPEHIFTCGSPVLCAKFHPTEGNLVVGACESGQVVIWDVRSGRLPVQRSSLNLLGPTTTTSAPPSSSKNLNAVNAMGGHVHPIIGMELLDNDTTLVTASSDGKVNFWSLANLRDPAESIMIPGGYLSRMAVAPETQSLLLGDESGALFMVVNHSSIGASGGATSAGGGGRSRRIVRKLSPSTVSSNHPTDLGGEEKDSTSAPGEKDDLSMYSHFGNVTGLSTKQSQSNAASTDADQSGVRVAKGFVRGANGFVLSCGVDWTTKLWAPAYTDKPLLNLLSHSYDYMSDVQWNPINPSIFATASSNGSLGLWNLASSLDEPITGSEGVFMSTSSPATTLNPNDSNKVVKTISRSGLNQIKWSQDGRRIIVTTQDNIYVLGMSEDVWKVKGDEEIRMMNNLKSRGLLAQE